MSERALGLRVAGTVFGIVATGHLLRLATRAEVVVAGWEVPLAVNALGGADRRRALQLALATVARVVDLIGA